MQFQYFLALVEGRWLTQRSFEACCAAGNERGASCFCMCLCGASIHLQYGLFLLWQQHTQPYRSAASFAVRGIPGISGSLHPLTPAVSRLHSLCEKKLWQTLHEQHWSCATFVPVAHGWNNVWGWEVSVWNFHLNTDIYSLLLQSDIWENSCHPIIGKITTSIITQCDKCWLLHTFQW